MDWSNPDRNAERGEDGYATVAATVMALALAVAAGVVMSAATDAVRQARAENARLRAAYGLASAQAVAMHTLLAQRKPGRFRWQVESPIGPVEVLAEPEQSKYSLRSAADLDDAALARFGVLDAEALRSRLRALAVDEAATPAQLAGLDVSPLWRACAGSLISPFGRTSSAALSAAIQPPPGRFDWRAGEIWRLRLISASGWAEDRIVRLTGDERNPAAVIDRRSFQDRPGGEPCRSLIE